MEAYIGKSNYFLIARHMFMILKLYLFLFLIYLIIYVLFLKTICMYKHMKNYENLYQIKNPCRLNLA